MLIESLECRRLMSVALPVAEPFSAEPVAAAKAAVAAPTNLSVQFGSNTMSGSVVAGAKANNAVLIWVTGHDATPVAGKLTITMYAVPAAGAANPTPTVLAASHPATLAFKNGSLKTIKLHYTTIPASLVDGDYTSQVQVTDSSGTVLASAFSGQTFTVAEPTLAVGVESLTGNIPSNVVGGAITPTTFKATLKNTGNIAATKPTQLELIATSQTTGAITVLATHTQFYKLVAGGGAALAPLKVKEFDLAVGTYTVGVRVTDQLGDITAPTSTLPLTIAPSTNAVSIKWMPRLTFADNPNAPGLLLETDGNATFTNIGKTPIVGDFTVNIYITRDDTFGQTVIVPVAFPPPGSPIDSFVVTLNLKPHQKTLVPITTSTPDPASSGAFFQYTLGLSDGNGGFTYYNDPQPAAT